METFEADVVVAGAGVVGLAVARALAMRGREVWLLERNAHFGEETSARNSEVVHAGIYYEPGSLKARHCVAGKRMLYEYCEARGVAHRHCGKLIVASDADEAAKLAGIAANAAANGVDDLTLLSGAEARAMEPALAVEAAIHSPSTGIVDSHALMLALLGEAEANGAQLVTRARIMRGEREGDGRVALQVGGDEPMRLVARSFVNAGGLHAPALTGRIEGLAPPPEPAFVKGHYFALAAKAPFERLIYPAPRDGGLGIHLTLDLAGRAKFGPDTEWLDGTDPEALDYAVDGTRRAAFAQAIRRYWPDLDEDALVPDYAGVRPKLAGGAYPDFRLEAEGGHVMLYGIESPGLTASLSLAEAVAGLVEGAP